jgi:hypothetical protein
MAGPPVDATVHRRAAGSVEFSGTVPARRDDPILIAEPQLYFLPAELPRQPLQRRRRVRDPTIFPHLASLAAFGYRHDDPVLVNIKPDT